MKEVLSFPNKGKWSVFSITPSLKKRINKVIQKSDINDLIPWLDATQMEVFDILGHEDFHVVGGYNMRLTYEYFLYRVHKKFKRLSS